MSNSTAHRKKGRRLLPALCNILGTVMLLSIIVMMLPTVVPSFTSLKTYNVVSGSMEPVIPVGSMIVVEPIEPEDLEEKDIIAFEKEGTVVCHRVMANHPFEGELITKGDASEEADLQPITYDNVIGKVTHHYDYLGDVASYMTTAAGKIYTLLIIACGIMFQLLAVQLR